MHKVFISHHHDNDQWYKEELVRFGEQNKIFIDQSVDTGDISDGLSDEYIRELIRDKYLRDSTVTIVLVGTETRRRKHMDWGDILKHVRWNNQQEVWNLCHRITNNKWQFGFSFAWTARKGSLSRHHVMGINHH